MALFFFPKVSPRILSFATALTLSVSALAMERPAFLKNIPDEAGSARPIAFAAAAAQPEMPTQKPPFPLLERIPLEAQHHVFSFLSPVDRTISASVLRGFNQIRKEQDIQFFEIQFAKAPEAFRTVLNLIGPMGRTNKESQDTFLINFPRLVKRMAFSDATCLELWKNWSSERQKKIVERNLYLHGRLGYPKSFAMVAKIDKELADEGNECAIRLIFEGYKGGCYGIQKI